MIFLLRKIFLFSLILFGSTKVFSQQYPFFKNGIIVINQNNYFHDDNRIAKSNFSRLDSIITNPLESNRTKTILYYNDNNQIIECIGNSKLDGNWEYIDKNNFHYDEGNNLVKEITFFWIENGWDTITVLSHSYVNGLLVESLFQEYKDNQFNNKYIYSYQYDPDDNLIKTTLQKWVVDEWKYDSQINFSYYKKGIIDSILFSNWNDDKWVNDKTTKYFYKENEQFTDSMIVKTWGGDKWSNFLKRTLVYSGDTKSKIETNLIWLNSIWVNTDRKYFYYNEFNNIESIFCQVWSNDEWTNGEGVLLFEYSDVFKIAFITQSLVAYYSTIVSLEDNNIMKVTNFELSQNFPNPFNPTTTIEYSVPTVNRNNDVYVKLVVYDLLGRVIEVLVSEQKEPGTYKSVFNAEDLPSGIYLYQLRIENKVESKKMILIK